MRPQVNTKSDMHDKWEYNEICNEPNIAYSFGACSSIIPPTWMEPPILVCLCLSTKPYPIHVCTRPWFWCHQVCVLSSTQVVWYFVSNQLTQFIQDYHFLFVYNLFYYGTNNIVDEISSSLCMDDIVIKVSTIPKFLLHWRLHCIWIMASVNMLLWFTMNIPALPPPQPTFYQFISCILHVFVTLLPFPHVQN